MDWYKINFDGTLKGNLGIFSCGIIIRNMNGDRVGGMAIPIGAQTNHVTEASAALYGLNYAKSLNLNKIWLEGYSLNIIICTKKVTIPSWTINNIIGKAIELINSLKFVLSLTTLEKQTKLLTG